jgi:hypothetical protein
MCKHIGLKVCFIANGFLIPEGRLQFAWAKECEGLLIQTFDDPKVTLGCILPPLHLTQKRTTGPTNGIAAHDQLNCADCRSAQPAPLVRGDGATGAGAICPYAFLFSGDS